LGWLLIAAAAAGIGYSVLALVAIRRFARQPSPPGVGAESVTLLKPLHGAEPRLTENLATFLNQDWAGSIEMVAGVQDRRDPAIAALDPLPQGPWRQVRLVTDPTSHGANAKVANLLNMMPAASHDLLVLSDSDMAVPPAYLQTVAAALAAPGVGAVTCAYRGRGDAGFWSVLGAAAVSYHFLPQVLVSRLLGDRRACMGSTIALRRDTLVAIGGIARFADVLADDHAIGAAVRSLGGAVAMPPLVLTHAATERSLPELWRHELRWAATVREVIARGEYLGVVLTQPVVPALLAWPLLPRAGGAALGLALLARVAVALRIDRLCGARTAPLWLLPARETLSFAVFAASLFARSVDWRGQRLRIAGKGRIEAPSEPTPA
jgi:ceramide glucosyltransferase